MVFAVLHPNEFTNVTSHGYQWKLINYSEKIRLSWIFPTRMYEGYSNIQRVQSLCTNSTEESHMGYYLRNAP